MTLIRQITVLIAAVFISNVVAVAQKQRSVPICRQTAFSALKPLPKMDYECPEGLNDYDEKILPLPARLASIRDVVKELQGFTDAAWWQSTVDELNACEVHGGVGELTDDEKQRWRDGDLTINLIGNQQARLVIIADPCYQTGYGGSNAFLLYRNGAGITISQVLNGYYSRVDNSLGIGFANLGTDQIIEISTSNSMPPSMVSYFFVIDPKTKTAMPKKLFKDGNRLTNEIYSAMLVSEEASSGQNRPAELEIIKRHQLAASFSAYRDTGDRHLKRVVYRWNGKFYAAQ
jgi:hypothetical protein